MAIDILINRIPEAFRNAYTAAPSSTFYSFLTNKDISFEDSLQKEAENMMFGSDDDIFEQFNIEEEDEDAVEKALFQLRASFNGVEDIEMMDTPYGIGLSGEEIDQLIDEYPSLPILAETFGTDVDDFYNESVMNETLDGASTFLKENDIDDIMQTIDRNALASGVGIDEEDRLIGDVGENMGALVGLGSSPDQKNGLLDNIKRFFGSRRLGFGSGDPGDISMPEAGSEAIQDLNKLLSGDLNLSQIIEELEKGIYPREDVLAWLSDPGWDLAAAQSGEDTDELEDAIRSSIYAPRQTGQPTAAFLGMERPQELPGGMMVQSARGERDSRGLPTGLPRESTGVPPRARVLDPGLKTPASDEEQADLEKAKAGSVSSTTEAKYKENLTSVFYNKVYAMPGGGRQDIQKELATLNKQTQLFYFLEKGFDAFQDLAPLLPEGKIYTARKSNAPYLPTGMAGPPSLTADRIIGYSRRSASDEEKETALLGMEEKYGAFLDEYFADPDQYRNPMKLKSYVASIGRILKKLEDDPLQMHMDVGGNWSSKDIEDGLIIGALFGTGAGTGEAIRRTNRRTLLKLSYTNGGMGQYSRAIHNGIDQLMDHYKNIGMADTEIFFTMANIRRGSEQDVAVQKIAEGAPADEATKNLLTGYDEGLFEGTSSGYETREQMERRAAQEAQSSAQEAQSMAGMYDPIPPGTPSGLVSDPWNPELSDYTRTLMEDPSYNMALEDPFWIPEPFQEGAPVIGQGFEYDPALEDPFWVPGDQLPGQVIEPSRYADLDEIIRRHRSGRRVNV